MRERIRKLKVGEGVESDHHTVIVTTKGEGQERKNGGEREEQSGEEFKMRKEVGSFRG